MSHYNKDIPNCRMNTKERGHKDKKIRWYPSGLSKLYIKNKIKKVICQIHSRDTSHFLLQTSVDLVKIISFFFDKSIESR